MSRPLIEVSDVGDVTIVRFIDRTMLDMAVIDEIGTKLTDLVDELGRRNLLVSFKGVDYVASWALGKLVYLNGRVKKVNGRLIVCEVNKTLLELLELTGLNKLIPVVHDEETGLKAF